MRTKENKGVTLIALAVTIIVMLILAGVTISVLTGNSGITSNASQAKMMNELSKYKEEVELYKATKNVENGGFLGESLSAGKDTINYNIKSDEEIGNIKTIIPDITDEYINILQIIKGELLIKTKDKNQIKAAQSVGIQINPYDITDDGELLSSNGNLLLVDSEGNLSLPDSVNKVGYGAFSNVEGLKTIIIPESVTEIGDYAFSYNQTLERVIKKGNLTRIGNAAFDGANNLKEINLPDSINYIGERAFRCTSLTQVVLPKNLQNLQYDTFNACNKLKDVVLNEGLKNMATYAFGGTAIEKIVLTSTIESINSSTFISCKNLKEIDVSKNNNFIFESNILFDKNKTNILFISTIALKNTNTFSIPEGIKSYSTDISGMTNIKKIIIPTSVTNIDPNKLPKSIESIEIKNGNKTLLYENGFLYNSSQTLIMCCSKEKDITVPEGIKTIGALSFKQATNVENVVFPDSLVSIQDRVFEGASNIKRIDIGKNVNNISPIFKRRNYNGVVNIDKENTNYVIENNILYKLNNGKKERLVAVLTEITNNIEISKEVNIIGTNAFFGQKSMTQIIIPKGVTSIEGGAFSECSKLERVEIPNTVTDIANTAFSAESFNLSEIIIHNKENSIAGAPWGAAKGMKVVQWVGK